MDNSMYFDGRDDGDSPMISPLTPTFDRYISRGSVDESPYFGDSCAYAPIQNDSYSIGRGGGIEQRELGGLSLDFLPTGDTMPRPYPGTIDTSPSDPSWDMDSTSRALYAERDSSEEAQLLYPQYGQSFDSNTQEGFGGGGFLPSPPNADGAGSYPTPGSRSKKSGEKKKRKHQASSEKERDEKASSGKQPQLRTASRAPKRYSQATARRAAESPEEVKARAAHNQVEQQYRKRLNQQFERLLAVLPQPDYDEGSDGDAVRGPMEKRISKAEVLDMARRRIKILEKERASLERQKRDLASTVVRLQDEWARRMGGNAPIKSEGK